MRYECVGMLRLVSTRVAFISRWMMPCNGVKSKSDFDGV
jgi:hypothetical protein